MVQEQTIEQTGKRVQSLKKGFHVETKTYLIKEIFGPTIQGEGGMTGTVTHFIRFAGCNMWSGRPEDREKSRCPYCDTDFFGGERFTAQEIIDTLRQLPKAKWVTISGGEPMLQFDKELCQMLQAEGWLVAIETNGTKAIEFPIDHITVSPKVPMIALGQHWANTLKVLYPHPDPDMTLESFDAYVALDRYIQPIIDVPMFGDDPTIYKTNLEKTLQKVYEKEGRWKLSPQVHKILGVR